MKARDVPGELPIAQGAVYVITGFWPMISFFEPMAQRMPLFRGLLLSFLIPMNYRLYP